MPLVRATISRVLEVGAEMVLIFKKKRSSLLSPQLYIRVSPTKSLFMTVTGDRKLQFVPRLFDKEKIALPAALNGFEGRVFDTPGLMDFALKSANQVACLPKNLIFEIGTAVTGWVTLLTLLCSLNRICQFNFR